MKLKGFKLIKDKGPVKKHIEEPELNENYLSLIYDTLSEVIFLMFVEPDDRFRFVSVNRAFLAVTGLTREQVVGKRIEQVFPEMAHALVISKYKEAISENKTVFREQVFTYPTGEHVGVVTLRPVRNAQGVCTHLVGSIHDITECKQADDALLESEEKFRLLAENSIDCIWVLDTRLKFTYLSPSVERILGYKPEELVGTRLSSHFKKKEFLKVGVLAARTIKNYKTFTHVTFETKMLNNLKEEVNIEISSKVLLNSQGKLIGIQGTTTDITERKLAEKALRESEERFRTIVETAPSLLIITDVKGKNLYVSPNCEEITGYTQEEMQGELLWWVHEGDTQRAKELFERTFREEVGYKNFEYKIVKKNREVRYVSSSWEPLKGENGEFKGIVFQTSDITERKGIEEKLRNKQDAEAAYTDILTVTSRTIDLNIIVTEGLSNLMKYTDSPLGVVYLCNRDSKTLLPIVAMGAEDTVAERSFFYGEGIPGEAAAKKEMVVATDLEDTIYKIPSGDGTVPPDTIISTPIIFKDALLGVILTCYTMRTSPDTIDFVKRVTDQIAVAINNANTYIEAQEMAAELKSERDKLEVTSLELAAASRTKSEFLANMSHELRTPLNSIIGFSEILHDGIFGPINEKQAKYLNNVLVSGKHLLQLINDILDLSKVEAGKIELFYEDFPVSDAINAVKTLSASIASKKRIVLGVSVDEGLPMIHADKGKFKQILYNLLSNAIKFTPEGGSVTVDARRKGDMAVISVTDTGVGISEEDQKKLFQPFVQADASTSRKYGGTGLGLSLVRKFSELHGGMAWVESEPGKGSTFTFTIPIEVRAEAEMPEDTRELQAGTGTESGQGAKTEVASEAEMPEKMREVPVVVETVTAEELAAIEMPAIIEPTGGSGDEPLILVVEDDKNSSELLTVILTGAGYRVIPAQNGREALAVAKGSKLFAITLDIMMPGMDGWDVLKYLKYDPEMSNIPVIVVSMLDEAEVGFSLGVVDYFVKPIEKRTLITALNNLKDAIGVEKPKVLVVDDEPDAVELVASIVEPAGFEIIRAYGGEEGIKRSFSEHPDVLILDLMMPDVSGFDVVSRLKMDPETRNIPIIICTSRDPTSEDIIQLRSDVITVMRKGEFARTELIKEIKAVTTLVRR